MGTKLSRRELLKIASITGAATGFTVLGVQPIAAQADSGEFSLAMVDWSDPVQAAFEETIIPRFVEENPGSSVTINWTNWGRYNEEMTTAFASGVTPDVFQGGAVWAPQMARRGWAVPLNDFISADAEWDWDDFPDGLKADVTIRGDIVAVPYRQDLRTLWYNKEMLAEAGLQIIGLGAGGLPTLGFMIAKGFRESVIAIGLLGQMLLPAGALIYVFLALNLINTGLDEVFNPRLKTTIEGGDWCRPCSRSAGSRPVCAVAARSHRWSAMSISMCRRAKSWAWSANRAAARARSPPPSCACSCRPKCCNPAR